MVSCIKVWREMHYNARDDPPSNMQHTRIVVDRIRSCIKRLGDIYVLAKYRNMQEFDGTSDKLNRVILYT